MPAWPWLLAQQAEPLISRLDPQTRAKALLALGAVVVLGVAMIVLIWLTGRATRRYMRSAAAKPVKSHVEHDDWARTPIVPPIEDGLPSDEQ